MTTTETTLSNFKVGDKAQYNKAYSPEGLVTILEIQDKHCLILFPSGSKIATPLSGLYPVTIPKSTFNVCHVCGKPIDKTDYCWAENIGDCKTGVRYGRFVTLQHHLKCNNPLSKSLW